MSGGPFLFGVGTKKSPGQGQGLAHTIVVSEVSAIRYK